MNAYTYVFAYLAGGQFISLVYSAKPHWLPNTNQQWRWIVRLGRTYPMPTWEASPEPACQACGDSGMQDISTGGLHYDTCTCDAGKMINEQRKNEVK
jgi:hypothetical protein